MSSKGYQSVLSTSPSSNMKAQEGVNEMPREEGTEEDAPLPQQQSFAIIEQAGSDDDEGISSDEGEGFVQNGGYQLLAQEPEGPNMNDDDDNEQEFENSPLDGSPAPAADAAAIPSALPYDPAEMQQYSEGGISQQASSTQPNLPQHLANLMPAQASKPDQTAKVSYSDTSDVRARRKLPMAEDDKIKAAMAGFKLPGVVAPQWANFVSEDDWKNNLGARLNADSKKETKQSGNGKGGSLGKR